jgi:hypothetical protein
MTNITLSKILEDCANLAEDKMTPVAEEYDEAISNASTAEEHALVARLREQMLDQVLKMRDLISDCGHRIKSKNV